MRAVCPCLSWTCTPWDYIGPAEFSLRSSMWTCLSVVSRVVCDWTQETDAVTRDPARMAASIQALARSVHGNTSEIFGELPRPPTRFRSTNQRSGTHCWHMNWTLTLCCAVDCQHHYIFSSFAFLLHECREFVRIVDCSILCKRNIVCCL